MVGVFYERVFADDEQPAFRDAFVRVGPIEHHISTQAMYWVDAMGGGRKYHGSSYRLHFHHTHNAEKVMNAAGARRWMHHMRLALREYDHIFRAIDPRIPSCILGFLQTKVKKYSHDFGWQFDPHDFDPVDEQRHDVEGDSSTTTTVAGGAAHVGGVRGGHVVEEHQALGRQGREGIRLARALYSRRLQSEKDGMELEVAGVRLRLTTLVLFIGAVLTLIVDVVQFWLRPARPSVLSVARDADT